MHSPYDRFAPKHPATFPPRARGPRARGPRTRGLILHSILIPLLLLLFALNAPAHAAPLKVPAQYPTVQSAIDAARPGDEVWVTSGTYHEAITMKTGVSLYGGFSGTETSRDQRDFRKYVTTFSTPMQEITTPTLSGTPNVCMDTITSSCLDGVTVSGGRAILGSGICCTNLDQSSSIRNCIVSDNDSRQVWTAIGGGISLTDCINVLISDCRIQRNFAQSDGGGIYGTRSSPIIINCLIANNDAGWSGFGGISLRDAPSSGGICRITASTICANKYAGLLLSIPAIVDRCLVVGNTGAGVCGDAPALQNSVISGNSQGVVCEAAVVDNCLVSGNGSDGFYSHGYGAVATNSTICDNGGTGVDLATSGVRNCIIYGNSVGILENPYGDKLHVEHCLINGNVGGNVSDNGTTYSSVVVASISVAGLSHNFAGDPSFIGGPEGSWTESPLFYSEASQTVLVDSHASFSPGSLVGKMLNPDTSQKRQAVIVSNTSTSIVVAGDATEFCRNKATYRIVDYHLRDGSPALDRADLTVGLPVDIEGTSRPGTDGHADIGAYEAPSEFAPPPDTGKPASAVSPLPYVITFPRFEVNYVCVDLESNVSYVTLYYRLNGGSWTRYGDRFTTSPIVFDTAQAGGDGQYEFYTCATDTTGNTEDPPVGADALTRVVTHFPGKVVYVDRDSTGTETGEDWAHAFRSIPPALQVASSCTVSQVWVAEGEYRETTPGRTKAGLYLPSNVTVYGGFKGDEVTNTGRNPLAHKTALAPYSYNSYPPAGVVIEDVSNSVLDGFAIERGIRTYCTRARNSKVANCTVKYLESSYDFNLQNYAIQCTSSSLSVHTTEITWNAGTAIMATGSSIDVKRCNIESYAISTGPFSCSNTTASLVNCILNGSWTSVLMYSSRATVANCLFPGGIFGLGGHLSTMTVKNCIFFKSPNYDFARAINLSTSSLALTHCNFYGDGKAMHDDTTHQDWNTAADINARFPGAHGNFDGDPLFTMDGTEGIRGVWTSNAYLADDKIHRVLTDARAAFPPDFLVGRTFVPDLTYGEPITTHTATAVLTLAYDSPYYWPKKGDSYKILDYHLSPDSPCIDAGGRVEGLTTDLDGKPRPHVSTTAARGDGSHMDIGPYEFQYSIGPSQKPLRPQNLSPADDAARAPWPVVLKASAFSDPDTGDTHAMSQWQISESDSFTTCALDTRPDPDNKTQYTVPNATLVGNRTYHWRVRYRDQNMKWSDWSLPTRFTVAPARIIRVPGDYPTIQQALDAALVGSEIIVSPGTYKENIHFDGKDVILRSTDPTSATVAANTIIDGQKKGAVVLFEGTESPFCRLDGFAITNTFIGSYASGAIYGGYAGAWYDERGTLATIQNNRLTSIDGTGIFNCDGIVQANTISSIRNSYADLSLCMNNCDGAIQDNVFEDNSVDIIIGGCNGLIQRNSLLRNANVAFIACSGVIRDNVVQRNENTASYQPGVFSRCSAEITNNTIRGNAFSEGGVFTECSGLIESNLIDDNQTTSSGAAFFQCNATIRGNTITNNRALVDGGAFAECSGLIEANTITGNTAGMDGGAFARCTGTIRGNLIADNRASLAYPRCGGGIARCTGPIEGNIIRANHANIGGGIANSSAPIRNNFITFNYAAQNGGGIAGCSGPIQNNTITANTVGRIAGGLSNCPGPIQNNIIWANGTASDAQISTCSLPSYSCIKNWTGGGRGNISLTPQFVSSGDFHLKITSPCIDAGMRLADVPRDIDGDTRSKVIRTGSHGDGSHFDIGADEYAPLQVRNISGSYDLDVLLPGKRLYADRTYTFSRVAPRCYGRDYLVMRNDEKAIIASDFLSLDVNQPVVVYIAADPRITPRLSWLAGWESLTDRLITTDDESPARNLFARHYPAGRITLGSNRDAGRASYLSMYSVVIVPESDFTTLPTAASDWMQYR